ncbi:hypothetical protein [Halomarina oriensis]|uniref:Uncharacterized protein n=1 Tax=Halomarina oriensis TaxID=671145 RepID=A0A6B0GT96_9EURY|nr:hypothetical protein [Halomarina oriensis]MWG36587.1 hypothetical protein [Halomarina oriensis]
MMSLAIGHTHAECPCVVCTGHNEVGYDQDNRRYTKNTLHGELCPCQTCGRLKTEYVDHFTWGEYECWWCSDRARAIDC